MLKHVRCRKCRTETEYVEAPGIEALCLECRGTHELVAQPMATSKAEARLLAVRRSIQEIQAEDRDIMAATTDWRATNQRRAELIQREATGKITADERVEIEHLQAIADLRTDLLDPFEESDTVVIMSRLPKLTVSVGRRRPHPSST